MSATVVCDYTFEAAHTLPHVPDGHPCGRMHGHSYKVEVHIGGAIDARMGWVLDFADVDAVMGPLVAQLDHQLLNDIQGLHNPTVELVAEWLWQRLLPMLSGLEAVVVHESSRCRSIYRGG